MINHSTQPRKLQKLLKLLRMLTTLSSNKFHNNRYAASYYARAHASAKHVRKCSYADGSRPRLTPLSPVKSTSRNYYRSLKRKVPRQTNFNKKRRVEKHASPCPVAEEDSEDDRSPVEATDESFTPFDNQPTENEIESQQRLLFPGSALTVNTSNALLQTLMCRHHFTHQVKAQSRLTADNADFYARCSNSIVCICF